MGRIQTRGIEEVVPVYHDPKVTKESRKFKVKWQR